MVDTAVVEGIRRFLKILPEEAGIHPRHAILYGSFARGEAHEWSDIDLVVIAPEFDRAYSHSLLEKMWGARRHADIRIEPIPCGEREWDNVAESWRPVIEIARQEGIVVAA